MKVITTKNPIFRQSGYSVPDDKRDRFYSALDASSSSDEVFAFQKWVGTKKGINVLTDGTGKFGPKTSAAYSKFRKEYDGSTGKKSVDIDKIFGAIDKGKSIVAKGKDTVEFGKGVLGKGKSTGSKSTVSTKPTGPTNIEKEGMSTTVKVLIGVGVLAAVGGVIYLVKKGKFKKK